MLAHVAVGQLAFQDDDHFGRNAGKRIQLLLSVKPLRYVLHDPVVIDVLLERGMRGG